MLLFVPLILIATAGVPEPPRTDSELYTETKVWSIHLTLTPEAWASMEPERPKTPAFGGMPPGPSMFLAPTFLKVGDRDGDGKLSAGEFEGLGARWFADWDKSASGKVSTKQLRDGLNALLAPPPGAVPAPPAMSLQGPKGKRNGVAAMIGFDFKYVHAAMEFEGRTFPDVAIRYKGNGTFLESQGSLKRSLKIDLNKFDKKADLAGATTLNLHSNVTDASAMNEALAYHLYRDAGLPAPRVSYAKVFLTVPGKHDRRYVGLYSLVENIDKRFLKKTVKSSGGAIYKPVTPAVFTDLGDDWDAYAQTYDPKTDLSKAQKRRLIEFCKLVSHASDADFAAKLGDYVDLDECAGYMAVMTWLSDMDGLLGTGQNFYVLLHPKTNKLLFVPWDQDHSFGQFPVRGTQEEREKLSIMKPWEGTNRFLDRLYRVDAFQTRYRARLIDGSEKLFRPERFDAEVADIAKAIRPAIEAESRQKLAKFDKAVAGESLPFSFGGGPGFGPPPVEEKEGKPGAEKKVTSPPPGPFGGPQWKIVPVRPFVRTRAKSVSDQLAGKSPGLTIGSSRPPMARPSADFGPGQFVADLFLRELDKDRDKAIARDEFKTGFARWFASWDSEKVGRITDAQLRAGIDKDLAFFKGFPAPAPGGNVAPKKP